MSEGPKRRRRLARYSLWTLFIVVAVFGCWLGYEVNWIRQRREVLEHHTMPEQAWQLANQSSVRAPGMLWLLGEQGVETLEFRTTPERFLTSHDPHSLEEVQRARKLFPEANVRVGCIVNPENADSN